MDGRADRHKSFIDMRYNTEQYSKSNSIEENRIKSYQINLKLSRIEQNRIKQNGIEIKSAEEIK